ncbi:MAG: hypothetical protein LGR52_12215 [Candidatus Thiosymbion ectosymbiont of Robbea hypermnestra]|nr:hypothetical protein [Candidatus Thiosymbion ectosymbiont of Robbea hypermnestra]
MAQGWAAIFNAGQPLNRHEGFAIMTTELLKQIQDGIGALRLDVNQRLDQTSERLDQTDLHLKRIEQNLADLDKSMRRVAERFRVRSIDARYPSQLPSMRVLQS